MSEHKIQCAFIEWSKWNCGKYPELELLYAIPNGGKRSIITAVRLKAEGAKAGIPDICLPVGRKGFNSLYLEFKNGKKGEISQSQHDYMGKLIYYNNSVHVVRDVDEAIKIVEWYLQSKDSGMI